MPTRSKRNALPDKILTKRIEFCIGKLKKLFKLHKVIIFGSLARGEKKEGTLDVLIVADTNLKFFDRITAVLSSCSGGYPPIEPIVYTKKEFEYMKKSGEGFIEDALEEGKVVFGK